MTVTKPSTIVIAVCLLVGFTTSSSAADEENSTDVNKPVMLKGNVSVYGAGSYSGFDLRTLDGAPMSHSLPIGFRRPLSASVGKTEFREWIQKTYRGFKLFAGKLNPRAIVNVRGEWDNGSNLLFNLGFPHTSCSGVELLTMPLDGTNTIVINCPGEVPTECFPRLRKFVEDGGNVLSSDCSLNPLIRTCFPGFIDWNLGSSKEAIVDVKIGTEKGLLAGGLSRGFWKLDKACQLIRVLDTNKVSIIAVSSTLAKTDPDKQGVLVAMFNFGKGRVLHTLGHLDNNDVDAERELLSDSTKGTVVSLRQMLVANYLIQNLRQAAARGDL
ncbi:hypothetical protein KF728_02080 [Candidatus Obscuribacterales bacterium]|nr:hypothetical protein [Candidatus Obscuribacterales bacterium]